MSDIDVADKVPLLEKKNYIRAVSPRLRKILYVVFALVALLGANAIYLLSVKGLKWITGNNYGDYFYLWMIILHLLLGLLLIVPFLVFGTFHFIAARNRRNRRAVRIGYALFFAGVIVLVTGVLLTRVVGYFDLRQPTFRSIVYWLHIASPLIAAWLYWLHRLAGPRIKWRVGGAFAGVVVGFVAIMLVLQAQDPRDWGKRGSKEGDKYFQPSLVQTPDGKFVSEVALMNDEYCMKCHKDIYDTWYHSAHRFSSFNNPAYLTSIAELRDMLMQRDGNVKASRWCAGCHDPVPFLAGKFDDPNYDIIKDPTAQAGITCTVCHGITHVNSTRGNADFTIEEPLHYPFAYSDNPTLQFINNQLVKAKPEFHKESMLKPFHKTAEFCSTCHKVHLPKELNHYKEFLRGQNHYDSFFLSGLGHGARSFYYPPKAEKNCNRCHLPLHASNDFAAKDFDGSGQLKNHSHLFPSANTAIAYLRGEDDIIKEHQEFLDGVMRVDIFGIKEGVAVDGQLHAPLRPDVPVLRPGQEYRLETVIRTLKMGHLFTQGTVDSNEVWLDITVSSGGEVIGRSGGMDQSGEVDPWSHFVNVFMLDRDGNRIDRRNAQDIFVPLYNHQIRPGAGQIVHYKLSMPTKLNGPVVVEAKLQYRKFDKRYMDFIAAFHEKRSLALRDLEKGKPYVNHLPVTTLAVDRVVFAVEGISEQPENSPVEIPVWQRWNDYGIGLFLEGESAATKGELRHAEYAFKQVEKLGMYHGPMNLARVYNVEARLDEAVDALQRAAEFKDEKGFPTWTLQWLTGVSNSQQGRFDEAINNFKEVLETRTPEIIEREFDFSKDYVVINALGSTLFERAKQKRGEERKESRELLLVEAKRRFEQTLILDAENVTAHHNLWQIYSRLGDEVKVKEHQKLHDRYRIDDNASDVADAKAQQKYPAAQHAAKTITIYKLNRSGAPELPEAAWIEDSEDSSD